MLNIFINLFKKVKNITFLIVMSLLIFISLRVLPVYDILKHSFSIQGMSATRKMDLLYEFTITTFTEGMPQEQVIVILLSVLTAINILLFVIFAKRQRKILSGKSFLASISGMLLGLFGVGCLSCGVLIMAPLLTFVGLGSYLGGAIEYAVWIAYVGIIFVISSIIYLLKKISEPLVCK